MTMCKLCGSKKTRYIFEGYNSHGRHIIDKNSNYRLFKCSDCGAVFAEDIKVDEIYYQKHYSLNYYNENKDNFLYNLLSSILIYISAKKKERNILNSFNNNKMLSVLDIGCGDGSFLSGLDNKKFNTYGVEINPEGIKHCQKKGLKIFDQDLLKIDFAEKKFDIITLWHVLEHIENSIQILNRINNILKKDGILILSTPNTDSFGFRHGGKKWFHLDLPRHLVLYNEKSLKKLLKLSNFEIIKIRNDHYEFPLDLFWSLKKGPVYFLLLPFYLFLKIFKSETLTIICKKI